jgi:hypothetical protein
MVPSGYGSRQHEAVILCLVASSWLELSNIPALVERNLGGNRGAVVRDVYARCRDKAHFLFLAKPREEDKSKCKRRRRRRRRRWGV